MVVEQQHPLLGTIKLPNLPFHCSDCDTAPRRAAPLLGQLNAEFAAELNCSAAGIDARQRDGVLRGEADGAHLPGGDG